MVLQKRQSPAESQRLSDEKEKRHSRDATPNDATLKAMEELGAGRGKRLKNKDALWRLCSQRCANWRN